MYARPAQKTRPALQDAGPAEHGADGEGGPRTESDFSTFLLKLELVSVTTSDLARAGAAMIAHVATTRAARVAEERAISAGYVNFQILPPDTCVLGTFNYIPRLHDRV